MHPGLIGAIVLGGILLIPIIKAKAESLDVYAKWGTFFGVSPELLKRIAKHESKLNERATNLTGGDKRRGGAWGLMQVTYSTAVEWIGKLEKRNYNNQSVKDNIALFKSLKEHALLVPTVNVMLGAAIMDYLTDSFDTEAAAVGAYNIGKYGMDTYLAEGKDPMQLAYVQRHYS